MVLFWDDHGMILGYWWIYPLENIQITMENTPFCMGKSIISMAMFNGYLSWQTNMTMEKHLYFLEKNTRLLWPCSSSVRKLWVYQWIWLALHDSDRYYIYEKSPRAVCNSAETNLDFIRLIGKICIRDDCSHCRAVMKIPPWKSRRCLVSASWKTQWNTWWNTC